MKTRTRILIGVGVVVLALGVFVMTEPGQNLLRRQAIEVFTPEYVPPPDASDKTAIFDGLDAERPRIDIRLARVAEGFKAPLAVAAVPGAPTLLIVLEKSGKAWWVDRTAPDQRGVLLDIKVVDLSEQGLLGLAFHPKFTENGLFFANVTVAVDGAEVTRVLRFAVPAGADLRQAKPELQQIVLEVPQPYQNHNAGDLVFGPDGMLYVGLGDGGFINDPHAHGQNRETLLGTMLRIDVDGATAERGYAIPPDNPWVDQAPIRPEIWAYGLRNPWRYTFAPDGRLIIADVGQDAWEEVTILGKGENGGWNVREAGHCFPAGETGCPAEGMVDPIYEYGREDGASITGGYVYTGQAIPELAGRYVFGDFLSGRLWALDLPQPGEEAKVHSLGRWGVLVASFGRDAAGEMFAVDFGGGAVYQLVASK